MHYGLPPDIAWDATDRWGRDWLKCGGKIVASVSKTVFPDGRWIANVNRHDERVASYPHSYFRTREIAMRSVERWACAHAARLRQEMATGARKQAPVGPTREEKRMARQMRG
jgi:predicted SAM-dependent methyltransferase